MKQTKFVSLDRKEGKQYKAGYKFGYEDGLKDKIDLRDRIKQLETFDTNMIKKAKEQGRAEAIKEVLDILNNLYKQVDGFRNSSVWNLKSDEVCDLCEEYLYEKIQNLNKSKVEIN